MPNKIPSHLVEKVKNIPHQSGVYLMKNASAQIIYIGKAVDLFNRVRSYFVGRPESSKTRELVSNIHDIDLFLTASAEEALVLELNLIKQHRPHYNIRLKDDKGFPYLRIDAGAQWPCVQIVRRMGQDGARYFGPFASTVSIRRTLEVARGLFHFRNCTTPLPARMKRPCLEYDMHRCPAPCTGLVTESEYGDAIKGLIYFLEGHNETLKQDLKAKMITASNAQHFEQAAIFRDQLSAVDEIIRWQKMAVKVRGDLDAIALASESDQACIQVFFIRNGAITGRECYFMQGTTGETAADVIANFITQYYSISASVPPLLLIEENIDDRVMAQRWLSEKRGGSVAISVPLKGPRKALMQNVAANASISLEQQRLKHISNPARISVALQELKKMLSLDGIPTRIEGYDISNIQGAMAVGSLVVFIDGKSANQYYRRFRIKKVPGANDYAMLGEMLSRRFKAVGTASKETGDTPLPDLILIDGGKGQLSAAVAALKETPAQNVPVIGLAKEREEIFIPGRPAPLRPSNDSPARLLVQRVRDEAHRFAVSYHRNIRKKSALASALENVAGVGPRRRAALLKHFGSLERICQASVEELASLPAISEAVARRIKDNL